MKDGNFDDIHDKMQPFFDGRDDIVFAVLFGSRSRGDYTDSSDLDVGILYTESPNLLILGGDVSRIEELTVIQTDLIVLNDLPARKPQFAYQLASEAKLVYATDTERYYDFKTSCFSFWFDFLPFHEEAERQMMERIANGTYGKPQYAKPT